MKVGTDGVLLGAWAELPTRGKLLDIGTGSGLIALMAAQRCPALDIVGIDIDSAAVLQARENVAASPFANRINIVCCSLGEYTEACIGADMKTTSDYDTHYSAIVCNPPFFEEKLLPPDAKRSNARHTDSLSFTELTDCSATLLHQDGCLNVILPTTAIAGFAVLCEAKGLHATRLCNIRTTASKPPKRTLATFRKCAASQAFQPAFDELILQEGTTKTEAYTRLTADFYLAPANFKQERA